MNQQNGTESPDINPAEGDKGAKSSPWKDSSLTKVWERRRPHPEDEAEPSPTLCET
jgi:hypothetical protein